MLGGVLGLRLCSHLGLVCLLLRLLMLASLSERRGQLLDLGYSVAHVQGVHDARVTAGLCGHGAKALCLQRLCNGGSVCLGAGRRKGCVGQQGAGEDDVHTVQRRPCAGQQGRCRQAVQ